MGTRVAEVADPLLLRNNHLDVINQSKENDFARFCLLLFCCHGNTLSLIVMEDGRRDRRDVPDS